MVSAVILLGSFNRTMEAQAGADAAGADVVINAEALTWAQTQDGEPASANGSEGRPDQKLAEAVSELAGVAEAEALSYVFLEGETSGTSLMMLAGDVPATRDIAVTEGSMPVQEGEILLVQDFAEAY
ncbi:hypothetical protein, partial [Streptococcus pneumoniae]|uniref:hypothetical protein n=1 Tax=Streptococcus pneumoniae TaxID=1313 RepID=UPI00344FB019